MRKKNTLNPETLEHIYEFICRHWDQFGYGPSMREIAESCFISRPNIYRYLDRLEVQGRILRDAGTARSITVVRPDDNH
jgi:SOS-response transcriptional repressor LexA